MHFKRSKTILDSLKSVFNVFRRKSSLGAHVISFLNLLSPAHIRYLLLISRVHWLTESLNTAAKVWKLYFKTKKMFPLNESFIGVFWAVRENVPVTVEPLWCSRENWIAFYRDLRTSVDNRSEKNSPSLISNLLTPETRLLENTHLKFRVTPTGLLDLATHLGVSPNLL